MTHGVNFYPASASERERRFVPLENDASSEVRLARPEEIGFDPKKAKELIKKGRTIENTSPHTGGT